jgi:GDPmannose 4,6-dehydratase
VADRGRRALVTGIGGQDGSYLAELLLAEGYEVFGVVHRPIEAYDNLRHLADRVELVAADLLDGDSLVAMLGRCRPDELYNLASVSFVPASWDEPVRTAEFAALGVTSLLEAIRRVAPGVRFYQASSSEIFGESEEVPQTEETPIAPLTPYGVAKAYGHLITRSYRRRYGLHASSGILYNHESPRRSRDFLPRKVSAGVAAIALGLSDELSIGDLAARRDWGYAGDYVRAMWLMLQQDEAADYVIASGKRRSVQELVEVAFAHVGLDWREHVRLDESLLRGKAELHQLVGDPSKARERLGWEPRVGFEELIRMLVDADVARLRETAGARP